MRAASAFSFVNPPFYSFKNGTELLGNTLFLSGRMRGHCNTGKLVHRQVPISPGISCDQREVAMLWFSFVLFRP